MKSDLELGKFISLILRHNPSVIGIQLDEHGWANVSELIEGINKAGIFIDFEILNRIVNENNKQRYSFNEDQTKIRANQGHSLNVDAELKEVVPPTVLYHGTADRFLGSIRQSGITKQSRQYIHLSSDEITAKNVGSRHGKPIILMIDAAKMSEDGYKFYLSENNVWLCENIPWEYITLFRNQKTTEE